MTRRPNIRPAERRGQYIRWVLGAGPSGGKTYTGLKASHVLAEGERFLVIDTEPAGPDDSWSADLYTDLTEFEGVEWDTWGWPAPYKPVDLCEALMEQSKNYPVIMVDSFSPFWHATGGIMAQRDEATQKRFNGNSWASWSEVRPIAEQMTRTLQTAPCHIVLCVRSKIEWEQTAKGPQPVGTTFKQDPELEHEVTLATYLDRIDDHDLAVRKSRLVEVAPVGEVFSVEQQDELFAGILRWTKTATPVDAPASAEAIEAVRNVIRSIKSDEERQATIDAFAKEFDRTDMLTEPQAAKALEWLEERTQPEPEPDPSPVEPEPPVKKAAAKKRAKQAKPKPKASQGLSELDKAVLAAGTFVGAITDEFKKRGWWPLEKVSEEDQAEALLTIQTIKAGGGENWEGENEPPPDVDAAE